MRVGSRADAVLGAHTAALVQMLHLGLNEGKRKQLLVGLSQANCAPPAPIGLTLQLLQQAGAQLWPLDE